MSDDSSSLGGVSGVVLPGLIVVALAVFGYKTAQPLLQSARPLDIDKRGFPGPPSAPGMQAFYARLWEDPLLACYQHDDKAARDDSSTLPPIVIDLLRRLVGDQDVRDTLASIMDSDVPVWCLPVMLPGTPFGDDHEHRLRMAYAVHAALAASGYDLEFPSRMSYVDLPVTVTVEINKKPFRKPVERFRVPIKLFRRADPPTSSGEVDRRSRHVVVLWINEDQAQDRPLDVIGQILERLFDRDGDDPWKPKLDVRVLGPFDSDTLKTFRAELTPPKGDAQAGGDHWKAPLGDLHGAAIYSSQATLRDDPATDRVPEAPPIYHLIGDDECLAKKLVAELKLRGATDGNVVLLTERDTLYGREFGRIFRHAARKLVDGKNIHVYRFLRGIDGALARDPAGAKQQQSPETSPQPKPTESEGSGTHDPTPQGRSQKDYLSRLEQFLVALHHQERMNGGYGISAIGVVGSDVYDKLLILRALRKRFPKVVFFTTDLDAAFTDVDERDTARNLIVVSHYGLALNPELQGETPPFRDSYQTASYLAALTALDHKPLNRLPANLRTDPWGLAERGRGGLKPLVFEIGLDGAYQLTLTSKSGLMMRSVFPRSPREEIGLWRHAWRAILFSCAGLALTFCALIYLSAFRRALARGASRSNGRRFMRRLRQHLLVLFLIIVTPFLIILIDHAREDGQPFSIHHGISLWPATYLRYLAGCTSLFLLYVTYQKLAGLQAWLYKQAKGPGATVRELTWKRLRRFVHRRSWAVVWKSVWRNLLVFNSPNVWRGWRATSRFSRSHPSARMLCNNCAQRWNWRFIFLRIVPLTAAFLLFALSLTLVDDVPSNPYRGQLSSTASKAILLSAVIAMLLLVFAVVDALQLCRRFVKSLEFADLDWDSADLHTLARVREGIPIARRKATRALYTMQVIVHCTNVVGKLVKYPFIVVCLMVIARLPAFDYLDLNWILVLLWALLLGLAGFSAHQLRKAALKTREEIVKQLRDELSGMAGNAKRSSRQEQAIRDIQSESGGAFGSFWSDPLVMALAIPFGGSTLILLIQLLLPYLVL